MPALHDPPLRPLLIVTLLLVFTANTDPQCVPVDPEAPVCVTAVDCEGLPHDDCEGAWSCDDALCAWTCDEVCVPALVPVSPQDLALELEDKDFLLINVHVPYEGEVPGTDAHLTYLDVPAIADYIGPDLTTKAVIYCKSNGMAFVAGNALVALGYCDLRYMNGGMIGWVNAGFELDYDPTPR
jgi:phage shock protein E